MSLNNRPMPRRRIRISALRIMTPEKQDALRTILATQEARKTDSSIYHVQTLDPELLRYPTPEELELLQELAQQGLEEIQQMKAERNQRKQD